jgi:hypothetical protein
VSKKRKRRLIDSHPLGLPRSGLTMVVWGLLLVLGGVFSQWWVGLPYPTGLVAIWGAATVLGLAFQGLCQLRWQPLNFYVWLAAIAVGWTFTLYVLYVNGSLFPELAPAWFLLLGLAYIHTGMKIDTRFYTLAVFHLVLAVLFEALARGILVSPWDVIFIYGAILFGALAGVSLLIGSYFARVPIRR